MVKIALIGSAGYIAERHFSAIKDSGNDLTFSYDTHDSVGTLDRYFPESDFFTNSYDFFNAVKKESSNNNLDYVTICSPNFMHKEHIINCLNSGVDVICEKPLALNIQELKEIRDVEKITSRKVNCILQLRHHDAIRKLQEKKNANRNLRIKLRYISSRGNWYFKSWKGDFKKSGGVAMNIGIHFFDMLHYVFGKSVSNEISILDEQSAAGVLKFDGVEVDWLLSIDKEKLPKKAKELGKSTYRVISIDGEDIDFSKNFTDLHTTSYKHIIEGKGFGIMDAWDSIETVEKISK